ncbi:MAG: TRAP transporter small permease [Desulfobacterales bacterium]|jgi:TRAP-type C4-dicarboxylate transport system permease small subunit
MEPLKTVYNGINKALTVVMASFLLLAMVVIGYQVFTRYILNFTPPWSEELARYCNIWITMLGIGVVFRRREHIKIDYLETIFTEKGMLKSRLLLEVISTTVTSIFFVLLVNGGVKILKAAARQTAPGLKISMLFVYIAIPIGCLFALLFIFERILVGIAKMRSDNK